MTVNEQFVRTHYPEAFADFEPPDPSKDRTYDHEGRWVITSGRAEDSPVLGRGSTADEAWADASTRIRDAGDVRSTV